MDFVFKKTTELSDGEIIQLCSVFSSVFEEHSKNESEFVNEFNNNELGYSFHGLMINDGRIVGAQSYIPFSYFVDNCKCLFALSVDTMILQEYRNFDNIFDLSTLCKSRLEKEGVSFMFGFPNENAYPLLTKGFGEKNVGDLYTYIFPYRARSINKKNMYLDLFLQLSCRLMLAFSCLSMDRSTKNFRIHKDWDTFFKTRYKWFKADYEIVYESDFFFVYKIMPYKAVASAFLMEVYPLSKKNFDKAVRIMFKRSHKQFEIALYVGHLHFSPGSMIKVPKKYEPKTFHFTGKILNKSILDNKVIFNIDNWDINLSNYDLL